jgi:hypothetical protein
MEYNSVPGIMKLMQQCSGCNEKGAKQWCNEKGTKQRCVFCSFSSYFNIKYQRKIIGSGIKRDPFVGR